MSFFEMIVAQVLKDLGDKNVIAVENRNMADYCKIWSLVEQQEQSSHLPWKSKYKYIPTKISLNDILKKPCHDVQRLATKSILFENYVSTPSFKKSEKAGMNFAGRFSGGESASKSMQETMKLGNIAKKEILWETLYKAINQQKVKDDHPLVKMISGRKERKLFLIGMIVYAEDEEQLEIAEEETESVDGGATVPSHVPLKLKASASEEKQQHTKFGIPAGTCLGFSFNEVTIDENGLLNLELENYTKH